MSTEDVKAIAAEPAVPELETGESRATDDDALLAKLGFVVLSFTHYP